MSQISNEADEIPLEELEAAADAYDRLAAGTFYKEHEAALEWLKGGRK
jgi:hypothetical protein